jgi:hypothetical protein
MSTWYVINLYPIGTVVGKEILTPILILTSASRHVKGLKARTIEQSLLLITCSQLFYLPCCTTAATICKIVVAMYGPGITLQAAAWGV